MLLLRRRLPLLCGASSTLFPVHHRACLLSTSAAPFSLENYLVAACGLPSVQARKASEQAFDEASKNAKKPFKKLFCPRLNSASNPDAILTLLSGVGLSRADIAAVVAADPLILRSSVKSMGPRLLALRDRLGLSAPQIARFLLVGSRCIRCGDVGHSIEFFIPFLGSFDQFLVIVKRNRGFLMSNLDRVIKPNITLLGEYGLSVGDIAHLCSLCPRVITCKPDHIKDLVLRAEALGVPRSSRMFKHAVAVVSHCSKEKVAAKVEFFKRTLACSEPEVFIAVSKIPTILRLSTDNLLPKIEFLINEVGMERQHILERPVLLALSLEKRLVPRHYIMKVLQAKEGLMNSKAGLFTFFTFGEETFRLKFIDCHKDSVPGLADAYAAARAGVVPSVV